MDADRLHLQHGPIDLIVSIDAASGAVTRARALAVKRFETILTELVAELPQLRSPAAGADVCEVQGETARLMFQSVRWFVDDAFVTPMAAVAGAVAQTVLLAIIEAGTDIRRASVNNGGDIALYLAPDEHVDIACVADPRHGAIAGTLRIESGDLVAGIATSGWHGRSQSLGIADAVTVLADSAAVADVAATLIANAVDVDSEKIQRRPARELNPDSDLGQLPVTVSVDPLPGHEVAAALDSGIRRAASMVESKRIVAALLCVQGRVHSVGELPLRLPAQIPLT